MRTVRRPLFVFGCLALLVCAALLPGGLAPALVETPFALAVLLIVSGRPLAPVRRLAPAPSGRSCPSRAPPLLTR